MIQLMKRGEWSCRRVIWRLVSGMAVIAVFGGCAGVEISRYYEHCAVVTGAPVATTLGEKVFRQGGNAFDAAVAVGFGLAVVHPQAGNIGGGGFAVVRDGKTGMVTALDFREAAPEAAFERMYLDEKGEVIADLSTVGVLAAGVPGTVAGLYQLWEMYGSLPWQELVRMSAILADTGFVMDEYLAASLAKYREELARFGETSRLFSPEGRTMRSGERFSQPDLARTLYAIAAEGPDGFYKGEVAEKIVACMHEHSGLITASDLEQYEPVWRDPIHFTFDSLDVYSMPPPSSGGLCVGQILKLLEPYDFSKLSPKSVEYIHLFCEAAKLAFADRSEHLGDPGFWDVPSGLLGEDYLKHRRSLIDSEHASSSDQVRPGQYPVRESDQTTHYCVCDSAGNMVAVTYTLNASYGCKLVVDGAGFLLNNEMDDFSIKPGHANLYGLVGGEANKIEPRKRMLSSMSPTLVLVADRPFMILGTPGGSKIITVVAQALVNFARFGLSLSETAAHPRFHHQWLPDMLYLEQGGFDINVKQGLIRYGHNIKERARYSDLQMIHIDENGMMTGASDPRGRGHVAGF